jgi:hypothetical protein
MQISFMKKYIFPILFLLIFSSANAQDTLTVLQYNLLQYGNNYGGCNTTNNKVSTKDGYIKTIINYIKPDIFSVNEMVASEAMMEHLLGELNNTWTSRYKRPDFIKSNAPYLANTIYYNSKKLTFQKQYIVQDYVRDINMYRFYYNSPQLEQGDTAFIICIVGHLKAGIGTDNVNKRKVMANNTMNYLKNHNQNDNYLLMGDFNLYTEEEPAWLQFTMNSNSNISFNDPVHQSGNWHNNYAFRYYHTQSTHSDDNGCASWGGMDDRFDFILTSNYIKNGTKHVKYVTDSYRAVGQDGKHFNKGLLDSPTNTSVPGNVLNALGKNSDHLPVTLKLSVDQTVGIDEYLNSQFTDISFVNPVRNQLQLQVNVAENNKSTMSLFDLTGKLISNQEISFVKGKNHISIEISSIKAGLYIIRLTDKSGISVSRKMIKQ